MNVGLEEEQKIKPCWILGFCPYGILVESFPLLEERNDESCKVYGHQCPVFTVGEKLAEDPPNGFWNENN